MHMCEYIPASSLVKVVSPYVVTPKDRKHMKNMPLILVGSSCGAFGKEIPSGRYVICRGKFP